MAATAWVQAANSFTWTAAGSGTWAVAANWTSPTSSSYPGAGDAAFLNDTTANRTVTYVGASGVTTAVGTLSLTQTDNFVNELDYQQINNGTLSLVNNITLGASGTGKSLVFIDPEPGSGNHQGTIAAPLITLNAGGVLEMSEYRVVSTSAQETSQVAGNVLVSGGTLFEDLGEGSMVGGDSLTDTITGSLSMSSGTISVGFNGPNGNAAALIGVTGQGTETTDRLTVDGNLNITGGTFVSRYATELITLNGLSNSIHMTSGAGSIAANVALASSVAETQILQSDNAIPGGLQMRALGTANVGTSLVQLGTVTSGGSLSIGLIVYQEKTTNGFQTLQLLSNIGATAGLGESGNSNGVTDTLDLNGFTLDDTPGGGTFQFSTTTGNILNIINSAGAGSIATFKANAFYITTGTGGIPGGSSIGSYVNLLQTGVGTIGTTTLSNTAGGSISPLSTYTFSATVAGVGSLISSRNIGNLVVTAQTLDLGSAITTGSTSAVTVSAGTLNLNGNALTAGSLTMSTGGTLNLAGAFATVGDLTGAGGVIYNSVSGGDTLDIGNNNGGGGSFSGIIQDNLGSGGFLYLLKTGGGTITLNGASKFSGGTTIQAGTLIAGVSNIGSTSGAFGQNNGVALSLGGPSGNANAAVLTGGAFTITYPITVAAGTILNTLDIGGNTDNNSTFSGPITLNNLLTISQVPDAGSNALSITGGITGGTSGVQVVVFAGPGNINVNTSPIANSGLNTIAVYTTGGTTTFGISNSYSGGTTLNGGTLTDSSGGVAGAFGSGSITVNPVGTLSTQSAELIANSNTSIASTAPVTVNNNASANGTIIFNSAAPTIATLSGSGNVVLGGASGTALTTGTTGNPNFSGVISDNGTPTNSGSLTTTGSGTFTLAGTDTYFGSTNVSGGTLNITGALANSGTVNLTGSSNLVLTGASALPSTAIVSVGANANVFVNAGQTIATISSAGNATFSAGTSIVGTGSGMGTGAGGGSTTGGISGTGTLTVNGTANLYAANITQSVLNIGSNQHRHHRRQRELPATPPPSASSPTSTTAAHSTSTTTI